jgi:hypothetical protein
MVLMAGLSSHQVGVQPALGFVKAIPAATAVVLQHIGQFHGTGLAADALLTCIFERVAGQVMVLDVGEYELVCPFQHGVVAQGVVFAGLLIAKSASVGILVAPYPAYPYIVAVQQRLHGQGFVQVAAVVGVAGEVEVALGIALVPFHHRRLHINHLYAKQGGHFSAEAHGFRKVKPGL